MWIKDSGDVKQDNCIILSLTRIQILDRTYLNAECLKVAVVELSKNASVQIFDIEPFNV